MRRLLILAVVAVIIVAMSVPAFAGRGRHHGYHGGYRGHVHCRHFRHDRGYYGGCCDGGFGRNFERSFGDALGEAVAEVTVYGTAKMLDMIFNPQPRQVVVIQPVTPVTQQPPGKWVKVFGKWVNGVFVKEHQVWIPMNP